MDVFAGLAAHDRVVHAGGAVDEVERGVEALFGQAHLRVVRTLVGDPPGVDGRHQDAVLLEHLTGTGAREHVERGLGHVRVRVAGPLVAARELPLHGRDVHHVLAVRIRGGHRRAQTADEQERCRGVGELHLEHLERIDLLDRLHPAVHAVHVGHEAAGVDRGAVGVLLQRRGSGGHREACEVFGRERLAALLGDRAAEGRDREQRMRVDGCLQRLRVRVGRVTEGLHLGQRSVGKRLQLGIRQQRVRTRRAAHGLRGVVDQDVERALGRDRVGEADHLGGVAQVDADDAQTVQPVRRVGQSREAPHGVARESGGDRGVRPVAEQPQRDVHADLGATTREQGALAGEVGTGVALAVAEAGAVRAELVVERIHLRVGLLADVAVAGLEQLARDRGVDHARGEVVAAGLVVDAVGRSGGGAGDHGLVGLGDRIADLLAAHPLDGLEHRRGRMAHGDEVRMLVVDLVQLGEYAKSRGEIVGVDARSEVGCSVGGGVGHCADFTRVSWGYARPRPRGT